MSLPLDQEVDVKQIEKESTSLVVKAAGIVIATNEDYKSAVDFLKVIKNMMKEVESTFNPIVEKARAAWKEALAQKDRYIKPLEEAEKLIKNKGTAFLKEQERLRLKAEAEARELARKEAEKLKKKAEREAAKGNTEKAEELRQKAEETGSMTPTIPPSVEPVAGVSTRQAWKFRIVDANAIPREYLIPNEDMLGKVARASKGTLKVAGVEFYPEDVMSVSGK